MKRIASIEVLRFEAEIGLLLVKVPEGTEARVGMVIASENGTTWGRIEGFALGIMKPDVAGYGLAQEGLRGGFEEGTTLGLFEQD